MFQLDSPIETASWACCLMSHRQAFLFVRSILTFIYCHHHQCYLFYPEISTGLVNKWSRAFFATGNNIILWEWSILLNIHLKLWQKSHKEIPDHCCFENIKCIDLTSTVFCGKQKTNSAHKDPNRRKYLSMGVHLRTWITLLTSLGLLRG